MGYKEKKIIDEVLLENQETQRMFRANSGLAWTGEKQRMGKDFLVLKNPRPFHGMIEGFPDVVGWTTVIITPGMVGNKVAIFTGVECKTGNSKLSKAQQKFKKLLLKMGGIFRVKKDSM